MAGSAPTSSPLSSANSSQATFKSASSQVTPQYRPASTLPFELLQHVQIYLEESLFSQALRFLLGLISASTSNERKKISIPPPEYLAVISTLTVHPSLTSRATTQDKWSQSNTALRLLTVINQTTGPVNSRLTEAYRFCRYDDRHVEEQDDEQWKSRLTLIFAGSDSLFSRAKDFWAVVGWALNCSCLSGPYATRWAYWSPWLEYMLNTLEADWEIKVETEGCQQSLIWQYINAADGGNGRGRRVLRAIFADGSTSALNEFQEIFHKELKGPKTEDKELKKQDVVVDVDQEIYGDWMQESESTEEDETGPANNVLNPRPSKRLRTRDRSTRHGHASRIGSNLPTDVEESDASTRETRDDRGLGPPASLSLRLRLLQLLASVSAHPELTTSSLGQSFPDLHELYTLFVEFIRPLPLPVFQSFVSPSTCVSTFNTNAHVALCEHILQRMVDNEHVSRLSTFAAMTDERFAKEYLPYAGSRNSIEDQARVGLLLESILRQLVKHNCIAIPASEILLQALDKGIARRMIKIGEIKNSSRYKKANIKDEQLAEQLLEESNSRMRFVIGYA